MIKVFLGEDGFTRQRALERAVQAGLGDRKDDPLSRQVLHAGDSSIDDVAARIVESCSTVSMFGPEQAVILKRAESLRASDMEFLSKWLKTEPECLLFIEGEKIDGRSEFSKVLKKVAKVEEFELPRAHKMAEWISSHCRSEFQKSIQSDAAEYLADAIGPDPAIAHAELEKIFQSDANLKSITVELAAKFVVPQREMDSFEIQKPFGERNPQAFVQTLRKLIHQGMDPIPIVSALYNHSVRLLHVQAMNAERAAPADIAKACGMMPFIYNLANMPGQAAKWPPALLPRVIKRLGEIDFELKIGRYANNAEFELAICALIVR